MQRVSLRSICTAARVQGCCTDTLRRGSCLKSLVLLFGLYHVLDTSRIQFLPYGAKGGDHQHEPVTTPGNVPR